MNQWLWINEGIGSQDEGDLSPFHSWCLSTLAINGYNASDDESLPVNTNIPKRYPLCMHLTRARRSVCQMMHFSGSPYNVISILSIEVVWNARYALHIPTSLINAYLKISARSIKLRGQFAYLDSGKKLQASIL